MLRPYATLPHPNALAGFLLVTALILFCHPVRETQAQRAWGSRGIPWFSKIAIFLAALTIPLTFSRTAIILEAVVLSLWLLVKSKINKAIKVVFIILLASSLYYLASVISSPSSLPDRVVLNQKALLTIQQSPVFGVGLGNFIPSSSSIQLSTSSFLLLTQPVHNIYLLLASELGIPATLTILYLILRNLFKIKNLKLKIPLLVVLASGAADHYWLTLHQNQLLLTILLALLVVKSSRATEHIL